MAATNNLKVSVIGGRTDNAGTVQAVDWDQEEMRMILGALLRPGLTVGLNDLTPNPNGFLVRQDTGANMSIKVGSGTSKRDGMILRGGVAGQGSYLVRLDATTGTYTVPATDPSLAQRYGVYLFVDDVAYSGDAARAYVDIACIRGTPNASPTTPGPLAVWSASALLWEFQLPAAATAVTNAILDSATSFDQRRAADLVAQNFLESQIWS